MNVYECYPSPPAGEGGSRAAAEGRGGPPDRKLLLARAKTMRTNPTEAERKLWTILRAKRFCEFKFKRQVVLDWYIVDFVNFERRLIVEADGSQHADNRYDQRRDSYLKNQGFNILRLWNTDALSNIAAVSEAIWCALNSPPFPSAATRLPPSPARGEGIDAGVSS